MHDCERRRRPARRSAEWNGGLRRPGRRSSATRRRPPRAGDSNPCSRRASGLAGGQPPKTPVRAGVTRRSRHGRRLRTARFSHRSHDVGGGGGASPCLSSSNHRSNAAKTDYDATAAGLRTMATGMHAGRSEDGTTARRRLSRLCTPFSRRICGWPSRTRRDRPASDDERSADDGSAHVPQRGRRPWNRAPRGECEAEPEPETVSAVNRGPASAADPGLGPEEDGQPAPGAPAPALGAVDDDRPVGPRRGERVDANGRRARRGHR